MLIDYFSVRVFIYHCGVVCFCIFAGLNGQLIGILPGFLCGEHSDTEEAKANGNFKHTAPMQRNVSFDCFMNWKFVSTYLATNWAVLGNYISTFPLKSQRLIILTSNI